MTRDKTKKAFLLIQGILYFSSITRLRNTNILHFASRNSNRKLTHLLEVIILFIYLAIKLEIDLYVHFISPSCVNKNC